VPHPRYLDFARHYGFAIKVCGPRKAHEKGRVEKGVHYVKQNFLAGLQLASLEAINAAARRWLDEVANVRVHGETHQTPQDLFVSEQPSLQLLTVNPYEPATLQTVAGQPTLPGHLRHQSLFGATGLCRQDLNAQSLSGSIGGVSPGPGGHRACPQL
jgi:hypothetical protein